MNSDTQLLLIGAIHTHHDKLKLSPLCVEMCEFCLGMRNDKPCPRSFHQAYSPHDFLILNFQDQLRRTLPHVYHSIFPQP